MSIEPQIQALDAIRVQRFLTFASAGKQTTLKGGPATHTSGLYWLYTDYTLDDLEQASISALKGVVDIPGLISDRRDLWHVCSVEVQGFRLVYNGIGSRGPRGKSGLRERILSEFSGGDGAGSLAISKSSLSDLAHWRYSYATLDDGVNNAPDVGLNYDEWAERLELGWRLSYGWPLLCTR